MGTLTQADLDRLDTNIKAGNVWVEGGVNDVGVASNGLLIKTITKINTDAQTAFDAALQANGFLPAITYAAAISFGVNDKTKTVLEAGVVYAPLVSALPFTTSGTFIGDDDARFYVIQGIVEGNLHLFTDLTFDSVAAVVIESLVAGTTVGTQSYYGGWAATLNGPIGGARYVVVTKAEHDIVRGTGTVDEIADHTLANTNVLLLELGPIVFADQFGTVGDDSTDNFTRLSALLALPGGRPIQLGIGTFRSSAELQVAIENTILLGAGEGSTSDGIQGFKTNIRGTSTTGAVIRVRIEGCRLSNFLISATTTRRDSARNFTAANYNCGLRIEGDDVAPPEGDVFATILSNMHVVDQPNDGINMVGRCFGSRIDNVICTNNDGHGLFIHDGAANGRTNLALAGIVDINNCTWSKNSGHGIRCGSFNGTDRTLRITVKNSEGLNNCDDLSLLQDVADSFYNCDGLTIINGAASGVDKSGTPNAVAGYSLMGQGGVLIDPRMITTSEPIRIIKNAATGTQGWNIINPHVRGTTASYIVHLDQINGGVENVSIWAGDSVGALANATDTTNILGLDTYLYGVVSVSGPTRFTNVNEQFFGFLRDGSNVNLQTTKSALTASTTPAVVFDASTTGIMWEVSVRHSGDPCASSATFTLVGGTAPIISNIVNQAGAAVTYVPTINGTNVELAVSSGTRATNIVFREVVAN